MSRGKISSSVLIFTLFLSPFAFSKSSNPKKFIKIYGITRSDFLKIRENGSEESPVKATLRIGEIVKIMEKLDSSLGLKGGFDRAWIKIKTNSGTYGYITHNNLLLLDENQIELWKTDYNLYKISITNAKLQWDEKSLYWLKENNLITDVSLAKGAFIWTYKSQGELLFFRYLLDTPFYLKSFVHKSDAEPVTELLNKDYKK